MEVIIDAVLLCEFPIKRNEWTDDSQFNSDIILCNQVYLFRLLTQTQPYDSINFKINWINFLRQFSLIFDGFYARANFTDVRRLLDVENFKLRERFIV